MVKAHAQPCLCQPLWREREGKTTWSDDKGDPKGWCVEGEKEGGGESQCVEG